MDDHTLNQPEFAQIKEDLKLYFRNRQKLISPNFSKVVADVSEFIEAVVRVGFEAALAQSPAHVRVRPDRPFIEVAEALVDHHIRFVHQTEHEMARKSLLDTYTHIAGPGYALKPTTKTRFVHALRRSNPSKFAALVLSLYLYNRLSVRIQDDPPRSLRDAKSLELYLLNVEGICRDVIANAVKVRGTAVDEKWVTAVIRDVETELLGPRSRSAKSLSLLTPTRT